MGLKRSKLKKRLRKKYHVGEFQEFGCDVEAELREGLTAAAADKVFDEFIEEIERRKLCFGGGSDKRSFRGFLTARPRSSFSEEQRNAIAAWLLEHAKIERSEVGQLVDASID